MRSFTRPSLVALATSAALWAAPAHAALITNSNPVAFSWSYTTETGAVLDGSGSLTVSGFNTGTLTVGVTLTNAASLASERLTAFGFGIDPNATGVTFNDANDDGIVGALLNNLPGLAQIEVCGRSGPNCSGGGGGGINGGGNPGLFDTFSLTLTGTWGASVTIDPIGVRYQTDAGRGSYTFLTNDPGAGPGTPIPEPMSLALLGLGLAGLGLVARQRRRPA